MQRPILRRAATGALAPPSGGPPADAAVLCVRGAGPYRIGAYHATLAIRGLVGWTQRRPGRPEFLEAGPTGRWIGVLLLVFLRGRLVEVGTATANGAAC